VNDWNSEKKDGVLCFIFKFKTVCLCLQEISNSKYLCNNDNYIPFLTNYKAIHRRANPNIPGMRSLYIGVHKSCTFSQDPLIFKYITSINLFSFWGQKCSISNMYFPQTRWKDDRLAAFKELD